MWGSWQVGQMTAEDYAKTAAQWAKALKLLDPSLTLILCGETGHAAWDYQVLKACISYIDMHSIHIYTCSNTHLPNVTAPLSAERAIEVASGLIDLARIEAKMPPTKPKVSSPPTTTMQQHANYTPQTKTCFDEWNVWDRRAVHPLRRSSSSSVAERLCATEQIRRHGEYCAKRQCHQPADDDRGWDCQASYLVAAVVV